MTLGEADFPARIIQGSRAFTVIWILLYTTIITGIAPLLDITAQRSLVISLGSKWLEPIFFCGVYAYDVLLITSGYEAYILITTMFSAGQEFLPLVGIYAFQKGYPLFFSILFLLVVQAMFFIYGLENIIASIFMVQNWIPFDEDYTGAFFWLPCCELQCFCLTLLIYFLALRAKLSLIRLCYGFIFASIAIRCIMVAILYYGSSTSMSLSYIQTYLQYNPFTNLYSYILGFILAYLLDNDRARYLYFNDKDQGKSRDDKKDKSMSRGSTGSRSNVRDLSLTLDGTDGGASNKTPLVTFTPEEIAAHAKDKNAARRGSVFHRGSILRKSADKPVSLKAVPAKRHRVDIFNNAKLSNEIQGESTSADASDKPAHRMGKRAFSTRDSTKPNTAVVTAVFKRRGDDIADTTPTPSSTLGLPLASHIPTAADLSTRRTPTEALTLARRYPAKPHEERLYSGDLYSGSHGSSGIIGKLRNSSGFVREDSPAIVYNKANAKKPRGLPGGVTQHRKTPIQDSFSDASNRSSNILTQSLMRMDGQGSAISSSDINYAGHYDDALDHGGVLGHLTIKGSGHRAHRSATGRDAQASKDYGCRAAGRGLATPIDNDEQSVGELSNKNLMRSSMPTIAEEDLPREQYQMAGIAISERLVHKDRTLSGGFSPRRCFGLCKKRPSLSSSLRRATRGAHDDIIKMLRGQDYVSRWRERQRLWREVRHDFINNGTRSEEFALFVRRLAPHPSLLLKLSQRREIGDFLFVVLLVPCYFLIAGIDSQSGFNNRANISSIIGALCLVRAVFATLISMALFVILVKSTVIIEWFFTRGLLSYVYACADYILLLQYSMQKFLFFSSLSYTFGPYNATIHTLLQLGFIFIDFLFAVGVHASVRMLYEVLEKLLFVKFELRKARLIAERLRRNIIRNKKQNR